MDEIPPRSSEEQGEGPPPAPPTNSGPRRSGRVDIIPGKTPPGAAVGGRTLVLIVGAVVLLAALGFGAMTLLNANDQSDTTPAAPGPRLSKDDRKKQRLIARGDAICKRLSRAQKELVFPDTAEDYAAYLAKVNALLSDAIKDLKALSRPKQNRVLLQRMFNLLDELLAMVQQARSAVAGGAYQTADQILSRVEKVNSKASGLALQYGFEECSKTS